MRILVVEDERKVASFIRQGLEEEGHAVEVAGDGASALELVLAEPGYDLIVLDVMLPRRDGLDVLKTLRGRGVTAPVLILTARDAVADKVAGLDLGADDYLCKPFAFEELLARARALIRRGRPVEVMMLSYRDVRVDLAAQKAERAGHTLDLTAKELALLVFFLRHPDEILSRTRIYGH